MDFDPNEVTVTGVFDSCDNPNCPDYGIAQPVAGPCNGPFGEPFKGFSLWTEYFPS